MTDRDRQINVLAELLENLDDLPFYTYKDEAEYLIDEYGVIVPPCKVGDTVYKIVHYKNLKPTEPIPVNIVGFHLGKFPNLRGQKRKEYLIGYNNATHSLFHLDIEQIGKTVFLTKDEAENALVTDTNVGSKKECEG